MNYKQFIKSLTRPQLVALCSQVGSKLSVSLREDSRQLSNGLLSSQSLYSSRARKVFKRVYG